ncbi:mediator of replication checkpoint protein 1 [[Candida] anglica]|uniref:Mediator of replication checkpoint protein 1 n=1 Tax=[Candida] anglica TaxID=148631 RepID=A0ABP0ED70_9ASCO
MDLLDTIEDRSGAAKTYQVSYEEPITQVDEEVDEQVDDTPKTVILNKIKSKLAEVDSTQDHAPIESMGNPFDFSKSILFGNLPTQNVEDTQILPPIDSMETQKLPQLDINDVEIAPETQVIPQMAVHVPAQPIEKDDEVEQTSNHEDTQPLFVSDTEDIVEPSKEERQLKIAKLAEARRQQRLAKEAEENNLVADISHTSLTDEENDLQHDTVVSSVAGPHSDKNMQEIEEFLHVQKRARNIQPEFKRKNVFTADKLLSAFNDDEESENESIIGSSAARSSPITSPVKKVVETTKSPQFLTNPISTYAQNLKTQLLSSPTKEEKPTRQFIQLDDSSDDSSDSNDELNEIPALSKDAKLHIKQKFLIKKMTANPKSNLIHLPKNIRNSISTQRKQSESKNLINNLQKANINQLQSNKKFDPLRQEMLEIEKDDEVMGSLLEREMERARNIRKREKLLEKAKNALINGEANVNGVHGEVEEVPDSDMEYSVDDSDYGSAEGSESENEEEEEDKGEQLEDRKSIRKNRRVILSDDEDDDPKLNKNSEEEEENQQQMDEKMFRSDDSYMFGAKGTEGDENIDSINANRDGYITTLSTQSVEPSVGISDKSDTQKINNDQENEINDSNTNESKYELFQNLQPRKLSSITQSQNSELLRESQHQDDLSHLKVPSFQDIATQQESQVATQVDISTQADDVAVSQLSPMVEDSDDEDIVDPSALRRARKLIQGNSQGDDEGNEQEEKEEEVDEEEARKQMRIFENKLRRNELRSRIKRKEMERKGLKNIIEGEAEESEDEWHGIGGLDAEMSDQANSEDEKMIDNNFNIDLNDDEVRRKFMDQYQIKDKQELEKLLDDIKNHRLTKRAGAQNGFDIELSDEEDELLTAYRKQRLAEQRARLLENKQMQELAKNEKSKAFFASIQDSTSLVTIDDDDVKQVSENEEKEKEDDDNTEKDIEEELDTKKKVIRVEEAFVQRQLSFLRNVGDSEEIEYMRQQKISHKQHGYQSDNEFEDLQTLKQRCLENLNQGKSLTPESESQKRPLDVNETDVDTEDEEFMPSLKRPSLVKSFRSNNSTSETSSLAFSGVIVSKKYKPATGSKSSIAHMSSFKKTKSVKEAKIAKRVLSSKSRSINLSGNTGFDM